MACFVAIQRCRLDVICALVALEARALLRNRTACGVLVLAVLAAASWRLGRDRLAAADGETCYVVYWELDGWVRRLEAAARENPDGLAIRVVHAGELADAAGTIRYPSRAHSIQLRPLRGPARRWKVWFWHSGSDPAALWPYSQWFWRVTAGHFGDVAFDGEVSPLRPEAVIAGRPLRLTLPEAGRSAVIEIALVWMVVFFAACHLAGQSLAEARVSRTIESLATTPAGWRGAELAKRLFYGGLAAVLAVAVTAILHPAALARGAYWLGLGTATLVCLGVAFVAGSWCRTVTSAGAAAVLYVCMAGVLFACAGGLSEASPADWAAAFSFEGRLLAAWRTVWTGQGEPGAVGVCGLLGWAGVWQGLGAWSYRRARNAPTS
ncbi:MAG TPA: hypothetical protein VML55_08750 [Planctomycetaceae bacterium]|nr:hypothetical protein [Planctomycetaceae bacterium]